MMFASAMRADLAVTSSSKLPAMLAHAPSNAFPEHLQPVSAVRRGSFDALIGSRHSDLLTAPLSPRSTQSGLLASVSPRHARTLCACHYNRCATRKGCHEMLVVCTLKRRRRRRVRSPPPRLKDLSAPQNPELAPEIWPSRQRHHSSQRPRRYRVQLEVHPRPRGSFAQ